MYCTVYDKIFPSLNLVKFGSFTYKEQVEEFDLMDVKVYIHNFVSPRRKWDLISFCIRCCKLLVFRCVVLKQVLISLNRINHFLFTNLIE